MRMKPSSPRPDQRQVDRATARNAALINQFATPGFGSLLARRWIAGTGQLLLAVTGFVLYVIWFVRTSVQMYQSLGTDAEAGPDYRLLKAGLILFAAAWLWALVTSLSLLHQAKRDAGDGPGPVPPRLET